MALLTKGTAEAFSSPDSPDNTAELAELEKECGAIDQLLDEVFHRSLERDLDDSVFAEVTGPEARQALYRELIAESHAEAKAVDDLLALGRDKTLQPAPGINSEPATYMPNPGDVIGNCKIIEFIGKGACGAVFKAHHTRLNITTAVKVLLPQFESGTDAAKRFLREAQSMARVRNGNVLRIYDVGEYNKDGFYLVADYVDGIPMDKMIENRSEIDIDLCLRLMQQVAEGIKAVHEQAIVHRDIKPSNVMVDVEGNALLMDFGLAKDVSPEEEAEGALTMQGYMLGTPFYLPPEQITDAANAGPASDIYSLGITFYQLLCGETPFSGDTLREILNKQLYEEPEPLNSKNPDVPEELNDLVMRMIEKAPQNRPSNGVELVEELAEVAGSLRNGSEGGEAPFVPPPSRSREPESRPTAKPRRRRPKPFFIVVVALVILGVIFEVYTRRADSKLMSGDRGTAAALHNDGGDSVEPAPSGAAGQQDSGTARPSEGEGVGTPENNAPVPVPVLPADSPGSLPGEWYTKPHIYAVMPFGTEAEGETHFFRNRIVRELKAKKAEVVERDDIDQIIAEIKLGQTDLTNRQLGVRAGAIIGAHIVIVGEVSEYQGETDVVAWAYDVETSEVLGVADITPKTVPQAVDKLTTEVAAALTFRSTITDVNADGTVQLAHGRRHGAAVGMPLRVLDADGKTVGMLRVTSVSRDSAAAKAEHGAEKATPGSRVEEIAENE